MMTYLALFLAFAKVGLFGFGGGLAMLPLIYQEAADIGGITRTEFSDLVGISQMTPGPIAVNAATYVGYVTAGVPGALIATLGVMLPSFVLVTLASYFIIKFKESDVVNGALTGIRPVTAGLVASAMIFMGSPLFTFDGTVTGYIPLAICLVSLGMIAKFNLSPLVCIAAGGAAGALLLA